MSKYNHDIGLFQEAIATYNAFSAADLDISRSNLEALESDYQQVLGQYGMHKAQWDRCHLVLLGKNTCKNKYGFKASQLKNIWKDEKAESEGLLAQVNAERRNLGLINLDLSQQIAQQAEEANLQILQTEVTGSTATTQEHVRQEKWLTEKAKAEALGIRIENEIREKGSPSSKYLKWGAIGAAGLLIIGIIIKSK